MIKAGVTFSLLARARGEDFDRFHFTGIIPQQEVKASALPRLRPANVFAAVIFQVGGSYCLNLPTDGNSSGIFAACFPSGRESTSDLMRILPFLSSLYIAGGCAKLPLQLIRLGQALLPLGPT